MTIFDFLINRLMKVIQVNKTNLMKSNSLIWTKDNPVVRHDPPYWIHFLRACDVTNQGKGITSVHS